MKPRGIPDAEWVDAIASDRTMLQVADAIDVPDLSRGGRPRAFHPHTYVLVLVVAKRVYGGRTRRAITELAYPPAWSRVAQVIRSTYPDRPDLWLPDKPIREHHVKYFKRYLTTGDVTERISAVLMETGAQLATELGLLSGNTGSLTNPTREECVESDAKIVSSITRFGRSDRRLDRETGELVQRRFDSDVKEYQTGDHRRVIGHRFVELATRGSGWRQRVMLGIARAPSGSELDTIMPMLEKLNEHLQITAVLYDGALRGKHIDELGRRFGIIGVAPVIAERVDSRDRTKRVERQVPLDPVTVKYDHGRRREIKLWARAGAPGEVHMDEAGNQIFVPIELQQVRRRGRAGRYRLYGDYRLNDGGMVSLPLYTTDEDRTRKFNRTEYVRVFPPGSPQYNDLYGRRSDTESSHRELQDQLWQHRANSYGRDAVYVDYLGWALGENAITRHLHLNSKSPPTTVAA